MRAPAILRTWAFSFHYVTLSDCQPIFINAIGFVIVLLKDLKRVGATADYSRLRESKSDYRENNKSDHKRFDHSIVVGHSRITGAVGGSSLGNLCLRLCFGVLLH
jgi:hypothetical protein